MGRGPCPRRQFTFERTYLLLHPSSIRPPAWGLMEGFACTSTYPVYGAGVGDGNGSSRIYIIPKAGGEGRITRVSCSVSWEGGLVVEA